jgi:hypothetical protein
MSEICCGETEGLTSRRTAAVRGAADWLALAASPTFAIMALLTTVWAGGPADMLCATVNLSPLSGMATMYLLMAAFHAGPWLKLVRGQSQVGPRHSGRSRREWP